MGRGNNSRAFEIPMTLEQAFPGLRNAPGGAIFAAADTLFDFTGPANDFTAEFLQGQSRQLKAQIEALDPKWHYDEIGPTDGFGTPIVTLQGVTAKVNDLRFQRAAIVARVQGDYRPLQSRRSVSCSSRPITLTRKDWRFSRPVGSVRGFPKGKRWVITLTGAFARTFVSVTINLGLILRERVLFASIGEKMIVREPTPPIAAPIRG